MKITKKILKISIIKSIYYSIKTRSVFIISKKVKINCNGKIEVKKGSRITIGLEYHSPCPNVSIFIGKSGILFFNGNVSIKKGCLLSVDESAYLEIGNKTFINEGTKILVYDSCIIGSNCAVSYDVLISDSDVHSIDDKPSTSPINIGNHVWISARASILKGVDIGNNAVIGSGSIVLNSVNSNELVVGIPAKKLRGNVRWKH